MASTAWTATRDELVRELTKARAEREIAIAEAHAAQARLAAIRRDRVHQNEKSRERMRARRAAEAIQELARAQRLIESIPTDPNAARHRADLIAALKEKS
jgi:hypothetical protein